MDSVFEHQPSCGHSKGKLSMTISDPRALYLITGIEACFNAGLAKSVYEALIFGGIHL